MLASVSGVCQLVLGILRLDSYMYYLVPFPLVLAALRSGPSASRKTLFATFFLTLGASNLKCSSPCFTDCVSVVGSSTCGVLCAVVLGCGSHIGSSLASQMSLVDHMAGLHRILCDRNVFVHLRGILLSQRESFQAHHKQCLHCRRKHTTPHMRDSKQLPDQIKVAAMMGTQGEKCPS